MKKDEKETLRCSFCGRTGDEVRKLVAGPNVYICDECVEVCQNIIDEELKILADKTQKRRRSNVKTMVKYIHKVLTNE